MNLSIAAGCVALAFAPLAAEAQITTKDIKPYSADMFNNCLNGSKDIATEYGVSDPLQIIGALIYRAVDKDLSGKEVAFWARQPIAVPISVVTNTDIDTTACEHIFSINGTAAFSVLGVNFGGAKDDVFRMDLREISKQTASEIIEGGIPVKVWVSNKYRPSFISGVSFTNPSVKSFHFFDTITIYVLRVERFKKVKGGLNGAIGWLSGGSSYQRDSSFKGTRIIATGTSTPLMRDAFKANEGQPAPAPPPPTSINSIPTLPPTP